MTRTAGTANPPRADDAGRPVAVRIHDVRSVWGPPLEVPFGERVTVLVGPNRSGTSNVAWAVAAALDATVRFEPARDLPRRRPSAEPEVTVIHLDGSRTRVAWDPATGTPVGGTRRDAGAPVVLSRIHETPRDLLRGVVLDLADAAGRGALADSIRHTFRVVLPEVDAVEIDERHLVRVVDDGGSALPIPECRALVALGIARHLAATGSPPAAVIVESPEVFLHPAAQEAVADLLVTVAAEVDRPVIVTTTSPFAIPRVAEARVVAVARDAAGRTALAGTATGDETQAALLGGLLRDSGLAAVLDRVGRVPADARAVLIVEGGTDEAYLRLAAGVLGRADVIDRVLIRPSGGAMGAALAAIVLRAEVDARILVLLDHDDAGRRARDTLVSRFGFDRSRQIITYADVFHGHPPGIEAETLFDQRLVRRFVAERGRGASHGQRQLHGVDHVDLTSSGKSAFVGWLETRARPDHLARWGQLLDLLDDRLR